MKPITPSIRTYVYRNLRRKCLSLMQQQLVVGYAEAVLLSDVEFRVRLSGRQKVLEQKQKNVHAFAVGKLASDQLDPSGVISGQYLEKNYWSLVTERSVSLITVSYNPYRFGYFFNVKTLEPVVVGKRALVTISKIYVEV